MNERSRRSKGKRSSLKLGKLFSRQGLASILMLCKKIQPFSKLVVGSKQDWSLHLGERDTARE